MFNFKDREPFFLDYEHSASDIRSVFVAAAEKFAQDPESSAPASRSKGKTKASYFDKAIFGFQDSHTDGSITAEISRYMGEVLEPRDCDVLEYWRSRETVYPGLAAMAKCYLAIPATSVSSERVFSKTKAVIGPQRARLSPSSIEMLLCLKDWYRLLGPLYAGDKPKPQIVLVED